jgi:serine/threonine protein phosphatase PrpC
LVTELKNSNGVVTEKARDLINRGIKTGFLKLDEHLSNEKGADGESEKSGTTATCAILSPEYIFFGNLG